MLTLVLAYFLARVTTGVLEEDVYPRARLPRGVPYALLNPDPNQYPGEIIEKDLASGKIDAAIVWGPIAGYYAKRVKTVLRMYPTGRLGEPDDIASAITFLVSERASWITGQVVSVNGGFVMP